MIGKGVGLLGRGIGYVISRPRLFGLAMIPPLITSVLFVVLLALIGNNVSDLARGITPFVTDGSTWAPVLRALAAIMLLALSVLVMVLTFAALTLAIGGPLYEKISERIDNELGFERSEVDEAVHRMLGRAIGQALITLLIAVVGGLLCFLIGLIPVIGAVIGWAVSALFGGWMIAREVTTPAMERRGLLTLSERGALLKSRRAMVLGFGVPTFWLLAIPFVSILAFPAAIAGGTLLVRQLGGESIRTRS